MGEELWPAIYKALAWNMPQKDQSPQHRLNRLAREHFPTLETWIGVEKCEATRTHFSYNTLDQMLKHHDRAGARPHAEEEIIVLDHQGKSALIDGNHRVNHHLKRRREDGPMSGILIWFKNERS